MGWALRLGLLLRMSATGLFMEVAIFLVHRQTPDAAPPLAFWRLRPSPRRIVLAEHAGVGAAERRRRAAGERGGSMIASDAFFAGQQSASARTSRPSASVLVASTVTPLRYVITSSGAVGLVADAVLGDRAGRRQAC